jgi:hypothetical protein
LHNTFSSHGTCICKLVKKYSRSILSYLALKQTDELLARLGGESQGADGTTRVHDHRRGGRTPIHHPYYHHLNDHFCRDKRQKERQPSRRNSDQQLEVTIAMH